MDDALTDVGKVACGGREFLVIVEHHQVVLGGGGYTEQYAFLDGIDKPADREEGTAWMLDNLGKYLAPPAGR